MEPFLQIFVGLCFIGLIIVLFFEKVDYILYSVSLIIIASIVTAIFIPETRDLTFFMNAVKWEVIFFFIAIFTIVEILKENKFFDEIGFRIIKHYKTKPRKLFYIICIVTTLLASVIAGISIVAIFIPIIIVICREIKINPTPFLLGISVCVNLAATLTPVGSAQNILIANEFTLDFNWFLVHIVPYFLLTFVITIFTLDRFVLAKFLKNQRKELEEEKYKGISEENPFKDKKSRPILKNLILLIIFIAFLILIPESYLVSLVFSIIFLIFNPNNKSEGSGHKYSLIRYLQKVDYKLIYFFICLFIFIALMEINGTLLLLEKLIENLAFQNELLLSIIILITTSLFSGFLDNTPVTIIFIPILEILIANPNFYAFPLFVAFILGVNLGGNFLPQGSPADLMILELGRVNKVKGLTYKKMVKTGGSYAFIHVLLGIGYLTLIILFFPN
ncbi:MAG: hypothetical protein EU531_05935 [Promethearchaeota archaeon]|nr:MAG: hypothetical protein EU531_05935 [Candidatus Lokiarchaeota archaeon]